MSNQSLMILRRGSGQVLVHTTCRNEIKLQRATTIPDGAEGEQVLDLKR